LFQKNMRSLKSATEYCVSRQYLSKIKVIIIDNSPGDAFTKDLVFILSKEFGFTGPIFWHLISSKENLGYGRGHNLVLTDLTSTYHLVLNPDVIFYEDTLCQAIAYLKMNQEVGLLSPQASHDSQKQYLCKNYPTLLILFLRGFASKHIQKYFKKRLADYEMRGVTESIPVKNIQIASGCFMFFKTQYFLQIKGFDPKFFLYFEDFDLSFRISKITTIAYVPSVRIQHLGGNTAEKGVTHIMHFLKSAIYFFKKHGLKLW